MADDKETRIKDMRALPENMGLKLEQTDAGPVIANQPSTRPIASPGAATREVTAGKYVQRIKDMQAQLGNLGLNLTGGETAPAAKKAHDGKYFQEVKDMRALSENMGLKLEQTDAGPVPASQPSTTPVMGPSTGPTTRKTER